MNWYIGQDIVAIKTSGCKRIKEGQVYSIKSLRQSNCKCPDVLIDVGLKVKGGTHCARCRNNTTNDGILWKKERLFAPLDSLVNIEELKEIAEEPIFG